MALSSTPLHSTTVRKAMFFQATPTGSARAMETGLEQSLCATVSLKVLLQSYTMYSSLHKWQKAQLLGCIIQAVSAYYNCYGVHIQGVSALSRRSNMLGCIYKVLCCSHPIVPTLLLQLSCARSCLSLQTAHSHSQTRTPLALWLTTAVMVAFS